MQFIFCLVVLLLIKFTQGESDIDALLELKKGIQDRSGRVLPSWDSNSLASDGCPQNWYGISCSDGFIHSITLDDMGLAGLFNFSAISAFKMLRNLSITNNEFSGSITREIGMITKLVYLDLSRNYFSGTIPSELAGLKSLVVLNLSMNSMEGKISSGFTSLNQLKYLDLHSNSFSEDVMHLLGQLGDVQFVDVSCNSFSGSLDLGLGSPDFISSVQYLNISNNELVGQLFAHDGMPYFDNLEVFDATNNHFVGNVPSFNFIVSLRVLKLRCNQLSGAVPEALLLESSTVLSELDLSHNLLEGPVGSISSMTLKNLNLSFNKLSGPLPAKIGHCAVIDLNNNLLSGNLSRIQNWGNYVEIIDLSSNLLKGMLPDETSRFLRLTTLRISNNSLEGALPPILSAYPELEIIDLSLNSFSGLLLPNLFNSTRLTDINMSFNNFTGTIPVKALPGQNFSLVSLDLSHNALTGHLPSELSEFKNLLFLDLSNNHFEGDIPSDFPNELVGFNVSNNNLSGSVPKNLQHFPVSSFRPGNSFLVLQSEYSSSGPNLNFQNRGSHVKSTIKTALIAGIVGGGGTIALLIFMVYFKFHHKEERQSPKGTNEKNDPLTVSQIKAGNEPGNTTAVVQGQKDLSQPEPRERNEAMVSPLSMMSSAANASPSMHQELPESPNTFKVCSPDKLAGDLHLFDSSLKFNAEELSCAPAENVGTSCHGKLYKATLGSGRVLAVKWLKEGIAKGRKEFAREARKLGTIRHPNLVSLQGYYWGPKDHEKLLISNYLYAPSLALYLHDTNARALPPLSLGERLKISLDVARCLNYLHNESTIPHGNLKSTNIMIETSNLTALVTDYSLHRIMTSAGTAEQVLNAGALGYRPPEFASTSRPCPSLKSDVYAFGVILLELLTGRNSAEIVLESNEVVDLTEWVRMLAVENRSSECFDRHIFSTQEHPLKILDSMLQVALRCILPADERPDMKMVFEDLSSIVTEHLSIR